MLSSLLFFSEDLVGGDELTDPPSNAQTIGLGSGSELSLSFLEATKILPEISLRSLLSRPEPFLSDVKFSEATRERYEGSP